jgi:hypothetical protein
MRTPDTKQSPGSGGVGDPKCRIGRALTLAYEPILEEPVPPTLAKMAERLDPPGPPPGEPSLLDRARRAVATLSRLILGRGRR